MRIPYKKGYSLVEVLVYLAIFTTMSVLVVNSFILVLSASRVSQSNRDLLESGANSLERISREIRQATSVDVSNSTLGSSPGVLQLNSTDSSNTNIIIKFNVISGALNLYKNGTLSDNLLGQNINASSLVFRRILTTNGEAIKVEMALQDKRSKNTRIENFYDTIILRGSY